MKKGHSGKCGPVKTFFFFKFKMTIFLSENGTFKTSDMFSMFYCAKYMGLLDLHIIALCFDLHFTQCQNFFGIGVVAQMCFIFIHPVCSSIRMCLKLLYIHDVPWFFSFI